MDRKFLIISLVGLLTFFAAVCDAREPIDLYVSQEKGRWIGECLKNVPCRELSKAISLAVPGDTINIDDGDYLEFRISDFHGTRERPLTIKALGKKVRIIPNVDNGKNRDNVYITNSDWVILDGVSSVGANRAGVRVDNSHHITIKNGIFADNKVWGIFTNHADDLLIENNVCYGSKKQHGIYVSNSGDGPIIRGNKVFENYTCGIHLNGDLSMGAGRNVEGDGIISAALIENNIIFNNGEGGGAGINMDGVHDSVVRNNLLYNNHATGIALYKTDGASGPKNIKLYNNTVDMASDSRWAVIVNGATGLVMIKNNILYNRNRNKTRRILSHVLNFLSFLGPLGGNVGSKNVYSDYNIYGGGSEVRALNDETQVSLKDREKTKKDRHSFVSDPDKLFVNSDSGDYHLRADSPAIDRGTALEGVDSALDGVNRPLGKGVDIGAYEFAPKIK